MMCVYTYTQYVHALTHIGILTHGNSQTNLNPLQDHYVYSPGAT